MITVRFVRDTERRISGMFMSGHAGYAQEGHDIICAGASTLLYTLVNSLERICGLDSALTSRIREGEDVYAEVIIPEGCTADADAFDRMQVVMETIYCGFISLAASVNTDSDMYINILEE